MFATVEKRGNSLAIRIPDELADEIGLDVGIEVEFRVVNGELRIKRRRRKRYDLDELLASVPDDYDEGEWDTGPAVGNEIWWRATLSTTDSLLAPGHMARSLLALCTALDI